MNNSDKKIEAYFNIVKEIAQLSVSKTKKVSCVIIKKNFESIASFGYNGSYSGDPSIVTTNQEEESLEPGESGFIHAEINALIKFREKDPENYIILLSLSPCKACTKCIVNAGFKSVFWLEQYRESEHLKIFDNIGIVYGDKDYMKKIYNTIK